MIKLHQFPPPEGLPVSASPYCVRVELYLRLSGREYESVDAPDPRKSPSRMVPWVTWPDGSTLADSEAIIERLEGEGPSLDEGLTDEERAQGKGLVARVDEPIYFSSLFARFGDPQGWVHQKKYISGSLPWLLTLFVPAIVRRGQITRCANNGFPDASGYDKAVEAIAAVSEYLGDKPFLQGDEPRVVDCAVWAQLLCSAHTTRATPARDAVRGDAKLLGYVERLAERAGVELRSYR